MRAEAVIEIFTDAFGRPRRANKKIASWRLPAGIDLAVKRDERDLGEADLGATVWLPGRFRNALGSFDVRVYGAGERRSSALGVLPTLCDDVEALAVKVNTRAETSTIVTMIRAAVDDAEDQVH